MTYNFRFLVWGAWFDSFDIHFCCVAHQNTCSNLSRSLIETMKIPMALKALGIFIPVGVTFLDFVGYIARVDGISMQPSLNPVPGQVDFVVLNKWAVRNYDISRGDIISLISPRNPDQRFIKRVVGLEGDVISTSGYKKSIVTVPEGHCWVEGDHIGSSLDSNYFGPVPLGLITAKATHVVWPPSRWCSLQNTKKG